MGKQIKSNGRMGRIRGPGLPGHGVLYSYEPATGLLTGMDYKEAADVEPLVSVHKTYDPARNAIGQVINSVGGTLISQYGYTYNPIGQITKRTRIGAAFAGSAGGFADGFSDSIAYNSQWEVSGLALHSGTGSGSSVPPLRQWGYSYDAIGNRQATTGDQPENNNTYATNALNQYITIQNVLQSGMGGPPVGQPIAPTYDADGNMTKDGRFTYEWDGENRLKSATALPGLTGMQANQHIEYKYDYKGRRVEKAVYGITYNGGSNNEGSNNEGSTVTINPDPIRVERYICDGWNVVEFLDGAANNTVVRQQTWGTDLGGSFQSAGGIGGLLAAKNIAASSPTTSGTSSSENPAPDLTGWLYLYDAYGNVGQVIDRAAIQPGANNTPAIIARYVYDAYGNTIVSTGIASLDNPYRFSTKYQDNETGLIYYGYRYYSPPLGRWISKDPLQEQGGLNLYAHVQNDPISSIDALGLCRTVTGTGNVKIDTDGTGPSHGDPNHQNTTTYPGLNSDKDNYVVAPRSSKDEGVRAGDPATVTANGKTIETIVGDFGPNSKGWGEMSVSAAKALGIPVVDKPGVGPVVGTKSGIVSATVTVKPSGKPKPKK